jgi:hypothetical protein
MLGFLKTNEISHIDINQKDESLFLTQNMLLF